MLGNGTFFTQVSGSKWQEIRRRREEQAEEVSLAKSPYRQLPAAEAGVPADPDCGSQDMTFQRRLRNQQLLDQSSFCPGVLALSGAC